MEAQFVDRTLTCSDCHGEFIFTAGEQLFFHDKEFKNDPKRCKPCKSRRSGLSAAANGTGPAAAGLSRTETRTECSECGVQTTVPFKPTQGRPVLCRQCFQARMKATAAQAAAATTPPPPVDMVAMQAQIAAGTTNAQTVSALTEAASEPNGVTLSPDAVIQAAASMASASPQSSVASSADLASIVASDPIPAHASQIPPALLATAASDNARAELSPASPEALQPVP
jgi:CxxC-x17-CxxC domain-containing protein